MIGILGMGKLGSAFAEGFLKAGADVLAYDSDKSKLGMKGVQKALSAHEVLEKSGITLFALKPAAILPAIRENAQAAENGLIVSTAANLPFAEMEAAAPRAKLIRIMPSIAASENLSPLPYAPGKNVSPKEEKAFIKLFSKVGTPVKVEESQIGILTAIVGSSPAYFAYFARAMREAAKEKGVPEETASLLLAQTLSGTGALLSRFSCEEIMEKVATKGGVTEKGIRELEAAAVYQAIKHAVKLQSK
jgi:pyrroline-5-carboxylate reductase